MGQRPESSIAIPEETIRHEGNRPLPFELGRSMTLIRVKQRAADTRPTPATRLEGEIREFWDAATALVGFATGLSTPGRRMALPAAIAALTDLATSHASHRLRRAAADRLMSFAPETAARLMQRRSAESKTGRP